MSASARVARQQMAARAKALATPAAHRRRLRSQTAYTHLSDAGALAALRVAFPSLVNAPAFLRPHLGAHSRVQRYLGDHRAIVRDGSGKHALVVSTLPLRARNDKGRRSPIDLTLVRHRQFFVPRNATVPITLPARLGDGAHLSSSGVAITPLTSQPNARARVVRGKLFYPNVARDTDQLFEPVAGGLESFVQLRSSGAPEQLAYKLTLPTGTVAHLRPDGLGLEITRGGSVLADVGAPATIDADGRSVRTSFKLVGNLLLVQVQHRAGDYRYPLVMDPSLTEQFDFRSSQGSLNSATGWTFLAYGHANVFGFSGSGREGTGLYVYVPQNVTFYGPGNGFTYGDYGAVIWAAPAGTNIFRADSTASTLQYFNFLTIGRGIWNPSTNAWGASQPYTDTAQNYTNKTVALCAIASCSESGGVDSNQFWMYFQANATSQDTLDTPYAYLSAANIYIHDGNVPAVTSVPSSETNGAWRRNNQTSQFTVSASDAGLGLTDVKVTSDDSRVNQQPTAPCNGHRDSRCPNAAPSSTPRWTPSFSYNTSSLREGITHMTATAGDAAGNRSAPYTWDVKVDRTPPEIDASGSFIDNQGQSYGDDDTYELWIDASDGSDQLPASGVASIEILVDGWRQDYVSQSCPESSCDMSEAWNFNPDGYATGSHTVQAVVTDAVGNTSTQSWTVSVARPNGLPPTPEVHSEAAPVVLGDGGTTGQAVCSSDPADTYSDAVVIVNGSWMGGTESTEYFDDGSYRVSRCDSAGNFIGDQTVTLIDVPTGGAVELPISQTAVDTDPAAAPGDLLGWSVTYPDPTDPIWATDWAADGTTLRASVLAPDTVGGSRPVAADQGASTQVTAASACQRGSFKTAPHRLHWDGDGYGYTVNPANMPGNASRAIARLTDGHRTWNQTLDRCKNRKTDRFHADYHGTSSFSIGDHHDGHNVVGFSTGKIADRDCGKAGRDAIACMAMRKPHSCGLPHPNAACFTEADIIFDGRRPWWSRLSVRKCLAQYDIWNVSTHETGHTLALEHIKNKASVMYPRANYCDSTRRVLAQPDVQGIRYLY
jgi:hypothetical protein